MAIAGRAYIHMLYQPVSTGMPSYFVSMLDDADRGAKYEEAISRCIRAFEREQGRAPRVLDLGCGSGLLSALALRHGARHVTALDVNRDMVDLCRATLEAEEGVDASRYTVVCGSLRRGGGKRDAEGCRTRSHFVPDAPFDVLVSEILGTMAFSEGLREYTENVLPYLERFPSQQQQQTTAKYYVVPQAACLTAAAYDFEPRDSLAGRLWAQALDACLPTPGAREVELTHSRDLGASLHLMGARRASQRLVVRCDSYAYEGDGDRWPARRCPCSGAFADLRVDGAADPARPRVVVFEWSANLYDGVTLRNTVEELERMDARSAAARSEHWGFMLCRAPAGAAVALRATAWERGMPRVALR